MSGKIEKDHFTEYVPSKGDGMVCDRLQFEVGFTECKKERVPWIRSEKDGTSEEQGPIRLKREE
jgi:hypothetical protein